MKKALKTAIIAATLITLLSVSSAVMADAAEVWNRTYGTTDVNSFFAICQATDGGYVATGRTISSTAPGFLGYQVWLVKTDSGGNVTWNKEFGGTGTEYGYSVSQTTDGGYIIAGYIDSWGAGSYDFWLVKARSDAVLQWEKTFGGTGVEYGYSACQTADGGYIIVGETNSYGAGGGDIWLVKADSNGNQVWASTFGGTGHEFGWDVIPTADGGYLITGYTSSYGAGSGDMWLVKTDSSGNQTWAKTYGGTNYDIGTDVSQTADGGYIITGRTASYGAGSTDILLIKTDSGGNQVWANTFGGAGADFGYGVKQTIDGGYIVSGYTNSYGAGNYDIWLIKTNINGIKTWDKTFGGTDEDYGWDVIQATDGSYIIAGETKSYGAGLFDGWLIKVGESPPISVGGSVYPVNKVQILLPWLLLASILLITGGYVFILKKKYSRYRDS